MTYTGEGGIPDIRARLNAMEANWSSNWPPSWSALVGKPSTFPPSAHVHVIADITGLQAALDSKLVTVSWADVTSKPSTFPPAAHSHSISDTTGLQVALDGKQPAGSYAPLSHVSDTGNPHAVTKAQVGLGNVDNTSDLNKPISTATQTALNGKQIAGSYATNPHSHAISDVTSLQAALDGKLSSSLSVSASSRVLNTNFQPHATKWVKVCYSVKVQVTNPLLVGTSTGTVKLLSDASNPPTTERARAESTSGVGVTVTLALTTSNTIELTYIVPPGHYVRLDSTGAGTFTNSIVSQVEEVIG